MNGNGLVHFCMLRACSTKTINEILSNEIWDKGPFYLPQVKNVEAYLYI